MPYRLMNIIIYWRKDDEVSVSLYDSFIPGVLSSVELPLRLVDFLLTVTGWPSMDSRAVWPAYSSFDLSKRPTVLALLFSPSRALDRSIVNSSRLRRLSTYSGMRLMSLAWLWWWEWIWAQVRGMSTGQRTASG